MLLQLPNPYQDLQQSNVTITILLEKFLTYFAALPLALGEFAFLWYSGIQLSSNFFPSTPVAVPVGGGA